jgi:hypothetical protein
MMSNESSATTQNLSGQKGESVVIGADEDTSWR